MKLFAEAHQAEASRRTDVNIGHTATVRTTKRYPAVTATLVSMCIWTTTKR